MWRRPQVELVLRHGYWIGREDFTGRFVHGQADPEPAGDQPVAAIDWHGAVEGLERGELPCSSSELSVLKIAASLGGGCPVSLRLLLRVRPGEHRAGRRGCAACERVGRHGHRARAAGVSAGRPCRGRRRHGASGGRSAVNAEKPVPGSAGLQLVNGVPLLHPEEQVFEAMLTGWRNQQLGAR
jgi:hypothetical protein